MVFSYESNDGLSSNKKGICVKSIPTLYDNLYPIKPDMTLQNLSLYNISLQILTTVKNKLL